MSHKRRIIIIEDDLFTSTLLEKSLKTGARDISVFHCGEDYIKAGMPQPDILILDYLFEIQGKALMNGQAILRVFREKYPNVPVMMLSAQEDGNAVLELMRLGIDEYIIKEPGFIEHLKKVIAQLEQSERDV